MTPEKLQQVLAIYRTRLEHFQPERQPGHWAPKPLEVRLHIRWMLDEIEKFGPEDHDKAQRWLGFIQGALWADGVFSIDQMREHNKADSK